MRILKTFFALILATSFLVACGGGATESTTTAGTGGGTTATEPALLTAYKKIKQGMTFDEVQTIVGTGYNFQMHEGDGRKYCLWTLGNYLEANSTTVQVAFAVGGGADNKYIGTKKADGTYDTAGTFNSFNNGW